MREYDDSGYPFVSDTLLSSPFCPRRKAAFFVVIELEDEGQAIA
jgi:hypothetical protein